MPHRSQSYGSVSPASAPIQRARPLPRTERLAPGEIARRAHAFNVACSLRGWTNGMVAMRLGVTETLVRFLRLGERPLSVERLRLLGELGREVIADLGLETPK